MRRPSDWEDVVHSGASPALHFQAKRSQEWHIHLKVRCPNRKVSDGPPSVIKIIKSRKTPWIILDVLMQFSHMKMSYKTSKDWQLCSHILQI
jgi:hypothetical protein